MKNVIFALILMSQYSMAARIADAAWDVRSQALIISLAYQGGCFDHQFNVQWDACAIDPVTQETTRFGLVLDTGWEDTCQVEQQQTIRVSEPEDGCKATSFVLKATSSKTTVVVPK